MHRAVKFIGALIVILPPGSVENADPDPGCGSSNIDPCGSSNIDPCGSETLVY